MKVQRLYAWPRSGDEIVQASAKAGGTCKEDVTGSSPVGGAKFFRRDFILNNRGSPGRTRTLLELVTMDINWRERVLDYQHKAMAGGVDVLDIEKGKEQRFLGLQIFIDNGIARDIFREVRRAISESLVDKIYWQSSESLHITLQSSLLEDEFVDETKLTSLTVGLESFFLTHRSLMCNFIYPLCAQSGIIGICDQEVEIYNLRKSLTNIWVKNGFVPVIKEEYWNFPYSFLGRFTERLVPKEKETLLNIVERKVKSKLSNVRLCLSDKFISPETNKVIKDFVLK